MHTDWRRIKEEIQATETDLLCIIMVVNNQVIFDGTVPKQRRDHHTRQRLLERKTKNPSLKEAVHFQHHIHARWISRCSMVDSGASMASHMTWDKELLTDYQE